MNNPKQLTEEQKVAFMKLLRKLTLEAFLINMGWALALILACLFTTILGYAVVHSQAFCAITGFINFIFYYKFVSNSNKARQEKYKKKFREVLGQ